ncbi:MAG: molybdopterin-dependent oxidoreductase [Gemmatimonadota bacterium]|jgi:isoquinoline 1-oxidoreductase beta subunit
MNTGELSRRSFLKTTGLAGTGLVVGFHIPLLEACASPQGTGFKPNAWIWVNPDGLVHVVYDEHEMGQGSSTGFLKIVAEEMEASWDKLVWEPVPTDPSTWVRTISTGGSTTIRLGWDPIRTAAAQAREMLREAAASRWGVNVSECRAQEHFIHHEESGQSLGYGELAVDAGELPVPEDPPLKDSGAYRLVWNSTDRLDLPDKVRGKTRFGIDVKVPNMIYAVVARPPQFQGSVASFDDTAARAVPGVLDVRQIEVGVAVYASDTWAALKGREALQVEFDPGPNAWQSTESLLARCKELAAGECEVQVEEGDVDAALAGAARTLEAHIETGFLDHAPMEPLNATVHVRGSEVEVWVPTQSATSAQRAAAEAAEVEPGNVIIHSTLTGGGFGRRLTPDDAAIATMVAKEKDVPVQTVFTREDTTRHGAYRPAAYQVLRAGLDAEGWPVAFHHRVTGPTPRGLLTGGAESPNYAFPNFRLDHNLEDWGIPLGAFRSVANPHTCFAVETFIDECAHAAGKDPLEYRRHLMRDVNPRLLNCLEMACERADWGKTMGERQGQGLASWFCFEGYMAAVAEVTVLNDGTVQVDRVVTASDHGIIVNPEAVRSQIEGGIIIALTQAMKAVVNIQDGAAVESNFHDYPLMTFRETPLIEVHFVETMERPGGVGEPPVPPPPAAVANAIFAATGVRVRKMPYPRDSLRA